LRWQEINKHILGVLEKRKLKSCAFVCGKRIDSVEAGSCWPSGIPPDTQSAIIPTRHRSLNALGGGIGSDFKMLTEFEADTLKNEALIRDTHALCACSVFPSSKRRHG